MRLFACPPAPPPASAASPAAAAASPEARILRGAKKSGVATCGLWAQRKSLPHAQRQKGRLKSNSFGVLDIVGDAVDAHAAAATATETIVCVQHPHRHSTAQHMTMVVTTTTTMTMMIDDDDNENDDDTRGRCGNAHSCAYEAQPFLVGTGLHALLARAFTFRGGACLNSYTPQISPRSTRNLLA